VEACLQICKAISALVAGYVAIMPAHAATMKATYTGTVYSSQDATGLFGRTGNGALDGLTATIEFMFNPSMPSASRDTNPTFDSVTGGAAYGVGIANPILSSNITIDGHTQFISGNYYGFAQSYRDTLTNPAFSQVYALNYDVGLTGNSSFIQARASSDSAYFPGSLDSAVLLTALGSVDPSGFGEFSFVGENVCDSNGNCSLSYFAHGLLSLTSVQISPLETPLPAALPLFATILAGGCVIAWRRKRRAAKVAA
jgi:hypothetical protein